MAQRNSQADASIFLRKIHQRAAPTPTKREGWLWVPQSALSHSSKRRPLRIRRYTLAVRKVAASMARQNQACPAAIRDERTPSLPAKPARGGSPARDRLATVIVRQAGKVKARPRSSRTSFRLAVIMRLRISGPWRTKWPPRNANIRRAAAT